MSARLKIHVKANERIFINGGVLRVDRKVSFELLNDVVFLLESHVLREEEATTPLRRLYFIVQSMLIAPQTLPLTRKIYADYHSSLIIMFKNQDVLEGLVEVRRLIECGRTFEALKRIRLMFPIEAELPNTSGDQPTTNRPESNRPTDK